MNLLGVNLVHDLAHQYVREIEAYSRYLSQNLNSTHDNIEYIKENYKFNRIFISVKDKFLQAQLDFEGKEVFLKQKLVSDIKRVFLPGFRNESLERLTQDINSYVESEKFNDFHVPLEKLEPFLDLFHEHFEPIFIEIIDYVGLTSQYDKDIMSHRSKGPEKFSFKTKDEERLQNLILVQVKKLQDPHYAGILPFSNEECDIIHQALFHFFNNDFTIPEKLKRITRNLKGSATMVRAIFKLTFSDYAHEFGLKNPKKSPHIRTLFELYKALFKTFERHTYEQFIKAGLEKFR